jgi:hypothetical protein
MKDAHRVFAEFLETASQDSCWCFNIRADSLEPSSLAGLLDAESEVEDK